MVVERIPTDQDRPDRLEYHGRILLVEDTVDHQNLVAKILNRTGIELDVVGNGLQGVEKALTALREKHPYDLILMDVQMPIMDGHQAVKLLRQKGYTAPIIAFTAQAMSGDREKCIKAGCDDYLSKPASKKQLLSLIDRYLKLSGMSDQRLLVVEFSNSRGIK